MLGHASAETCLGILMFIQDELGLGFLYTKMNRSLQNEICMGMLKLNQVDMKVTNGHVKAELD